MQFRAVLLVHLLFAITGYRTTSASLLQASQYFCHNAFTGDCDMSLVCSFDDVTYDNLTVVVYPGFIVGGYDVNAARSGEYPQTVV